jgi:hypothetical protein
VTSAAELVKRPQAPARSAWKVSVVGACAPATDHRWTPQCRSMANTSFLSHMFLREMSVTRGLPRDVTQERMNCLPSSHRKNLCGPFQSSAAVALVQRFLHRSTSTINHADPLQGNCRAMPDSLANKARASAELVRRAELGLACRLYEYGRRNRRQAATRYSTCVCWFLVSGSVNIVRRRPRTHGD